MYNSLSLGDCADKRRWNIFKIILWN